VPEVLDIVLVGAAIVMVLGAIVLCLRLERRWRDDGLTDELVGRPRSPARD
jgi:hypothetical protein